jgi:hypothetical protein
MGKTFEGMKSNDGLDDELRKLLESLPADKPRSRLEPFREFILRWRRQGRSYRRIHQILHDECKVEIAYEPLRRFVQRRSRPRKVQPEIQPEPATIAPVPPDQIPPDPSATPRPGARRSPEEIAAMREAASALNHKPVFQPEQRKPRFVYDPDRPLTNKPTKEK